MILEAMLDQRSKNQRCPRENLGFVRLGLHQCRRFQTERLELAQESEEFVELVDMKGKAP